MRIAALLLLTFATSQSFGSALFDDESILEVTLSGPLTSVYKAKRTRDEYPFALSVDGKTIDVEVRIRGHSRTTVCSFPPLRLNFTASGPDGTIFEGEDKLKLVTHCRTGDKRSENALLNEYAAYRVFNVISNASYRVRLLKIFYVDTDGKRRKLDEPQFGFLIESDEGLARRLGGDVAEVEAVRFSTLDVDQNARLNVFQYIIGNTDWSLAMPLDEVVCCHNLDLIAIGDVLFPIPYDFDLAGSTAARYRRTLSDSRSREYSGYCRTSLESMAQAIEQIDALRDEIIAVAQAVPATSDNALGKRTEFVESYFDESADKPRLLEKFERNCVGRP